MNRATALLDKSSDVTAASSKSRTHDNASPTDRLFCGFHAHANLAMDICGSGSRRSRHAR
jgi:hypothetical protein